LISIKSIFKNIFYLLLLLLITLLVLLSFKLIKPVEKIKINRVLSSEVNNLYIDGQEFRDLNKNGQLDIYEDHRNLPQDRANDLLKKMTLEEKVAQMCQYVGLNYLESDEDTLTAEEILNSDSRASYKGFLKKDIAQMVVDGKIGSFLHVLEPKESNALQSLALKSRLKIPLIIGIDAIHGNGMVKGTTVYPSPISISSTFSDTLSFLVGEQTALEMRATGAQWAFTPNIDVLRDPRWGRVGETFGEDPLLVSNMGVEMIKGLQKSNRVIACAKHFIAGSEPINGLNSSPMDISERNLREIFLKPFKKAVDAGVYSIMTAHNELNGVPCHMNKYIMKEILRDEYNFKGFIVSDWMDIERIHTLHKVAKNLNITTSLLIRKYKFGLCTFTAT